MKRLIASYIPVNYQFIFLSLALLMLVNLLFRAVLFFLNIGLASGSELHHILYSFFNRGLLFDICISSYILFLPFALVSIPFLANKKSRYYLIISNLVIMLAGIILIAVSAIDLGYFRYYNSRITGAVFTWIEEVSLTLKVVLKEFDNLLLVALFLMLTGLYAWVQHRIYQLFRERPVQPFHLKYRILIFTFGCFLLFSGLRGTFNPKDTPLLYREAFFSDDHFLNQLGFNPVYHLGYSYKDPQIKYFKNEDEFIEAALGNLHRNRGNGANPFEIHIEGKNDDKPNIILVFMESMSNAMVSRYNPGLKTTPFLDSLAEQGIVFDNFYSAGIHTHNAIFTTLYGLPAVMNNVPMNSLATENQLFHGLPLILKQKNYYNSFYVTGSKEFDNMSRFLTLNGFDRVIGDKDYAPGAIYNLWGATDETMFHKVLQDCDSLSRLDQPFFCGILTISSHNGYIVPDAFENKLTNKDYPNKLFEYADLQLKDFMISAAKSSWFEHTVFVFVGDHGQNFKPVYDMNLNYNRVPLILYAPAWLGHKVCDDPGLQQDIYPTLFGLLDFNYMNTGLGVDLLKQKREFGFFSADNKLGVIDDSLFLVYRGKDNISLYEYRGNSTRDIYADNPEQAGLMLNYGFSMVQSANYLIENNLTGHLPSMVERQEVSRFIAHAGGMIDGHDYTNSLEALNHSFQNGFQLLELDISRTSDSVFVAVHDWEKWQEMTGFKGELPPPHEVFMQYKLYGKYSPMDMVAINAWFADHPDAILVTDKINEPGKFSALFTDKRRLMMELFTLDAIKEGIDAGIRSAMASWNVLSGMNGDKVQALKQMGVTDVAASRRVIKDNLPLLVSLKNNGIRVYVFHVNYDKGKDEAYVICNDMDYIYGMYADTFDFSRKINCP
jgi:phosphoglycerol transferase MdoB-like AlkP superfamily enzyme